MFTIFRTISSSSVPIKDRFTVFSTIAFKLMTSYLFFLQKIAAPSIVKKGIDSDQSNNHDFDRLDDDLNSIANNMPNQRAENFRTRNTIAQKVVSKRRALIRAAYKLVYGQK